MPASSFNPGVLDRLERESLVEYEMKPSPYKHRKFFVRFAKLTEQGLAQVKGGEQ